MPKKVKTKKKKSSIIRKLRANPRFNVILLGLVAIGLVIGGYYLLFSRAASSTPVVGVQFHGTWSSYSDAQRTQFLDKMAAAKVPWIRLDVGWASLEEAGAGKPSQWYYSRVDSIIDQARARNIKVLVTVLDTPGWANGGKGTNVPPSDASQYGRIMGELATRYKGKVAAWEVWNEPNLEDFWVAKDPVKFAALLKAAYPKIKAADPTAQVVIGGSSMNDDAWVSSIYNAGAKGSFDVMATHPYMAPSDLPPEAADDGTIWRLSHVAKIHDIMVDKGDGNKPIWFTEFGWSSHPTAKGAPNWEYGVTEAQQADYLVRALKYIAQNFPYVQAAFWYTDKDYTDSSIQNNNYGLLNVNLGDKPAYISLMNYLKGMTPTPTPTLTPTSTPVPTRTPALTTTPKPTTTPTAAPTVASTPVPTLPTVALTGLNRWISFDWIRGKYYIQLAWVTDSGSNNGYYVYARDNTNNPVNTFVVRTVANATSANYYGPQTTGLENNTSYTLTVTPINQDGSVGQSKTTTATTQCFWIFCSIKQGL